MRKNRKGFTLVELLAAIVILGILMVFSIPMITGMLNRSRDKMYIDDAKKLISQAEYQMRSSSNDIDIPDPGDCIIISLVYLDNGTFDNPPNGGKYLQENSYVVIKNNGGKLEYSATIVEKFKKNGGYKGVVLTTSENLYKSNAVRNYVKSFKEEDLVEVDDEITLDKAYINKLLPAKEGEDKYLTGSISGRYNYPINYNDSINGSGAKAPKIKLRIESNEAEYHSLHATLFLTAEAENKRNLEIYISDNDYRTTGEHELYGDKEQYTYNLDFSNKCNYSTGGEFTIYVFVKDTNGNTAQRSATYKVSKNVAPRIEEASISKLPNDSKNMLTALVKANISDDITSLNNLKVCVKESKDNSEQTCSNNEFKTYKEVFNNGNTFEYNFNCGGSCTRNGTTHYLNLIVKDEQGAEVKTRLEYTFSTNEAPKFEGDKFEIASIPESFTATKGNKLIIDFKALDDLDTSKLSVSISDGVNTSNYSYVEGNGYRFDIRDSNGNDSLIYDGSSRNIVVTITDSEGKSKSLTTKYDLYKNENPRIDEFKIDSNETACSNESVCPLSEGGSFNTTAHIDVYDDMGLSNLAVKYCKKIDGNESCTNYENYSSSKSLNSSFFGESNYNGQNYELTVYVKDSYGKEISKKANYSVYKNKAPNIKAFTISPKGNGNLSSGTLDTNLYIEALDDFDGTNLRFNLIEDGVTKISNANLSDYNGKNVNYTVSGGYDGVDRNIKLEIYDSKSLKSELSLLYNVYENIEPYVGELEINSDSDICTNSRLCDGISGGDYNVKYSFIAYDDMDSVQDMKLCISEDESACSNPDNFRTYSQYYNANTQKFENIPFVFSHDNDNPFNGDKKKAYIYIIDSLGLISSVSGDYSLYNNNPPTIITAPQVKSKSDEYNVNLYDAEYTIEVEDDTTSTDNLQIKYCMKYDGNTTCNGYEPYRNKKDLDSSFFGSSSYDGQIYEVYSVIKDGYGLEYSTDSITYQVFEDSTPEINIFDIAYEVQDNSISVTYAFEVDDYFDTYSVCIGNSSNCSNYSGNYSGSDGKTNRLTALYTSSDSMYSLITNEGEIYISVKDSNGKISYTSDVAQIYSQCSYDDPQTTQYEFYFDSNKSYVDTSSGEEIPASNNQRITMDRCSGQCYDHDNIFGYYDRRLTYKDRFDPSVSCNNLESTGKTCYLDDETNEEKCIENYDHLTYKATCSFKDCFSKNNSYERHAIGTMLNTLSEEEYWSLTINGNSYLCTSYYKLYLSSYDNHNEGITLTEIENEKICGEAIDEYAYKSSDANPYVRVFDGE